MLERAYAQGEGWRELLRRLPEAGLFPDDRELVTRMTLSGRQDVTPAQAQAPDEEAAAAPPPGGLL